MSRINSSSTTPARPGSPRPRQPPTLEDLLDVASTSNRAIVVIRLPEMVILSGNSQAGALFGRSSVELEGGHASRLFHGADEIYTTIGLGALAAGAIASYSGSRRLAGRPDVTVRTFARLIELASGERVGAKLVTPAQQSTGSGALDEEFAARQALVWEFPDDEGLESAAPTTTQTHQILDALTSRQREIVTALLQCERVSTIAQALCVSRSTVRSHLTEIFAAFSVHNQAELIAVLRHPREAAH
jgi:DNA-binding CsgD family transcriptional regulator